MRIQTQDKIVVSDARNLVIGLVSVHREISHQGGQMTKRLAKQVIFKDKSNLLAAWGTLLERGDKFLQKLNSFAINVITVVTMPEIVQIIM